MRKSGIAPILMLFAVVSISIIVLIFHGGRATFMNSLQNSSAPASCPPEPTCNGTKTYHAPSLGINGCSIVTCAEPVFNLNWKGYQHKVLGYEIMYPEDWILDEKARVGEGGCSGPTFFTSPEKEKWLTICEADNSSLPSVEEMKQFVQSRSDINSNIDIVSVKNGQGVRYETQYPEYTQHLYNFDIYSNYKKNYLLIQFVAKLPILESDRVVFDQIISTLRLPSK